MTSLLRSAKSAQLEPKFQQSVPYETGTAHEVRSNNTWNGGTNVCYTHWSPLHINTLDPLLAELLATCHLGKLVLVSLNQYHIQCLLQDRSNLLANVRVSDQYPDGISAYSVEDEVKT